MICGIYERFPSVFGLGLEDGHVLAFKLLLYIDPEKFQCPQQKLLEEVGLWCAAGARAGRPHSESPQQRIVSHSPAPINTR